MVGVAIHAVPPVRNLDAAAAVMLLVAAAVVLPVLAEAVVVTLFWKLVLLLVELLPQMVLIECPMEHRLVGELRHR